MSKITIFIAIFIILSASFMAQVLDFFKGLIGETGVTVLLAAIMAAAGAAFFVSAIRKKLGFAKTSVFAIFLVAGLVLAWQIKILPEKIHILEYGILGWFAAKDTLKPNEKYKTAIPAFIFCLIAGLLDEAFQAVLPYRFFEIKDIVFNALGGAWGVGLFLFVF